VGSTSVGHLLRCLDDDARARDVASPSELPDALATVAARIADAARRNGRVVVSGTPETASDVDHVVVEFVHPVITGARSVSAIACHETEPHTIQRWMQDVARPSDIVIAVASSSDDPAVGAASSAATRAGASIVTLANRGDADLVVGSIDGIAAKELRVVAYHVLWELVQMSLAAS
jgi:D-sedoheptulose 7-phosphate isomerase